MSQAVSYLEGADKDLREAMHFYEERSTGLGGAFLSEIERAVARASASPKRWMLVPGPSSYEVRRVPVRRFPHVVIFTVASDHLFVLAVADPKRDQDYWRGRTIP